MEIFEDRRDLVNRFLPKEAICAEVGAGDGAFFKYVMDVSRPAELHLIDSWCALGTLGSEGVRDDRALEKLKAVARWSQPFVRVGRVVVHQGRSPDVLASFRSDYLDWIYIDAGHDLPEVHKELRAAQRIVKPGGLIAGHDLVLDEKDIPLVKNHYGTIKQAVKQFCHEKHWEIVALTKVGTYEEPDAPGRNSPSYVLKERCG